MAQYKITMNSISGAYEAESRVEALDRFAQDAGYKNWSDACAQGLASDDEVNVVEVEEWLAWEDGKRDEVVSFFAPVAGAFDIAEAGASALGVEISEALNVKRA